MNEATGTRSSQPPTPTPEVEDKPSKMMETIMFGKLRRQGYDFNAAIDEIFEEKMQILRQTSETLQSQALHAEQAAQSQGNALLEEIASRPIFEAANFQGENIQQALASMQLVTAEITTALALSEKELQQKEIATARLNSQLTQLRKDLKEAHAVPPGISFLKMASMQATGGEWCPKPPRGPKATQINNSAGKYS